MKKTAKINLDEKTLNTVKKLLVDERRVEAVRIVKINSGASLADSLRYIKDIERTI